MFLNMSHVTVILLLTKTTGGEGEEETILPDTSVFISLNTPYFLAFPDLYFLLQNVCFIQK